MDYYIVADVGGTQIRTARFPLDQTTPDIVNRITTQEHLATPLERLIANIRSVWPETGVVRMISLAIAGPSDPYKGIIIEAPNIAGWINLPIKNLLELQFNVPVSLGNDANLAALAEWKFGAGRGHHHLIYITVSTGIGGGVIIDDRMLLGHRGLAGELGHVTVVPDGPLCGCGQRGHLETYSAGPGIARWVEEQILLGVSSSLPSGKHLSAKEVALAAEAGDELARLAFARAGTYLGRALADYLHIFNPTVIIIGGGVSLSGDLLMDPLKTALREYVLSPHYLDDLVVTTAALGDNVGLMGALALAHTLDKR